MRTIAVLLLATALPALSQIRSDQALAPVVFGAAPPKQYSARVASDGTNFFAVWRSRTASDTVMIGASRLTPSGELLDRPSIFLASGTEFTSGYADVVFVGGNFLVVYESGKSVFTRRFSRDGHAVDAQPVVISNSAMSAGLATNGKTVFLSTGTNRFRMLAPDGTPLGAERLVPNAGSGPPSIASNGDRYLIAYPQDAYGSLKSVLVLLTGGGDYIAAQTLSVGAVGYRGAITTVSNGASYLVTMAGRGPVFCIAVDADGQPGAVRTLDNQTGLNPIATWSGSEYTVIWQRTLYAGPPPAIVNDIAGARVNAAGLPLDATPLTVAPAQNDRYVGAFASAWNGRDTIIITGDTDASSRDWHTTAAIFTSLAQIDSEPANRRHAAIASSAIEQASGSIASNGTVSLVSWRERSSLDQAVVRAAFVAADGQIGDAIDLGESDRLTATATASNGRDFIVAYVDTSYRLVARRVTLEGVVDSTPLLLTDYGFVVQALAIGWSGQAYVIATTGERVVMIMGVSSDGAVIGARQVIDTLAPADTPAVSCGINGCGVTWHWATPFCGFPVCYYAENDLFTRTDASGNAVSRVSLTDSSAVTPALSFPIADGKSLFVYSSGTSMFAGRITAAGVVLDTPAVNGGRRVMTSETSLALQPVSVVKSGLYFVEPDDYTKGRLYWSRIDPEPTPRVAALVNLHQTVTLPVTLTASARNTYLVYTRGDDDAQLMAPRLFLRTLASPDPQPSPVRKHAAH
jgi:hypothetical protein